MFGLARRSIYLWFHLSGNAAQEQRKSIEPFVGKVTARAPDEPVPELTRSRELHQAFSNEMLTMKYGNFSGHYVNLDADTTLWNNCLATR